MADSVSDSLADWLPSRLKSPKKWCQRLVTGWGSACSSASFIVGMHPGASRQLLIKIGRLGLAWGNEPTTHPLINIPLQINNISWWGWNGFNFCQCVSFHQHCVFRHCHVMSQSVTRSLLELVDLAKNMNGELPHYCFAQIGRNPCQTQSICVDAATCLLLIVEFEI